MKSVALESCADTAGSSATAARNLVASPVLESTSTSGLNTTGLCVGTEVCPLLGLAVGSNVLGEAVGKGVGSLIVGDCDGEPVGVVVVGEPVGL